MAQRRPKPIRAVVPYAVRTQVWRDMQPTGRTGRKLVASFPRRTGLMRRSYRCFRSGRKFLRVAFGRRADYWVHQYTSRSQRVPVAIRRALRRAIRQRKILNTVHRLTRRTRARRGVLVVRRPGFGLLGAMLRRAPQLRPFFYGYDLGRRVASYITDL